MTDQNKPLLGPPLGLLMAPSTESPPPSAHSNPASAPPASAFWGRFGHFFGMLAIIAVCIGAAQAIVRIWESDKIEIGCFANILSRRFPFAEHAIGEHSPALLQKKAEAILYLAKKEFTDPKSGETRFCPGGWGEAGRWLQAFRALSLIRGVDPFQDRWSFLNEVPARVYAGSYAHFPAYEYRCATTFTSLLDVDNPARYDRSLAAVGKPIGSMVLYGPKDCRARRGIMF